MNKKLFVYMVLITVLLTIALLCVAACAEVTAHNRTVTDMKGNVIELPDVVDRYAVIWNGAMDIAAMLDNCQHIVGYPEMIGQYPLVYTFYPQLRDLASFPKANISVESVLETDPQVVFIMGTDHADLAVQLKKTNIAVVDVEFNSHADMQVAVRLMADVLGTDEARQKAEDFCAYVDESMAFVRSFEANIPTMERPTALVFRDAIEYNCYGSTRFPGIWVELSGATYAMVNDDPYKNVKLTTEQIAEYDPDYIFFVFPGSAENFRSDRIWAGMKAVQHDHVIDIPCVLNTWSNSGCETALQFRWAVSIFYPEAVNYSIRDEVKDFYSRFFGIMLTDAQMEQILTANFSTD